jgi:hypothetical protein
MTHDARIFRAAIQSGKYDVAPLGRLIMDAARQNEKRPAWVKLAVPDALVLAAKHPPAGPRIRAYLVIVPAEVEERLESRIILPGR